MLFLGGFMPYIAKERREALQDGGYPENAGELNYIITKALRLAIPAIEYYVANHELRYQTFNDVFGALFGAAHELIRRIFPIYGIYENAKIRENGDVYLD